MRNRIRHVAVFACICMFGLFYTDNAFAQQQRDWNEIFRNSKENKNTNRGVLGQPRTAEKSKSVWPKLFQKKDPSLKTRPIGLGNMDWLKPKDEPKRKLFDYSNDSRPKVFENMKNMFPQRDPDRPNFFAEMNGKTKEFFERKSQGFSNWANNNTERAKNKSFESWDSITKGFRQPQQNQSGPQAVPLRSARQTNNETARKVLAFERCYVGIQQRMRVASWTTILTMFVVRSFESKIQCRGRNLLFPPEGQQHFPTTLNPTTPKGNRGSHRRCSFSPHRQSAQTLEMS